MAVFAASLRGHVVREPILQWIGTPVGIYIGTTKTLADLANHVVKSADRKPGIYPIRNARVCNLEAPSPDDLAGVTSATEIGDIWGSDRD